MNDNRKIISRKSGNGGEGVMQSSCTIAECVQIARGVAEDAIADYHQSHGNVQLSMSIQIELLKELVFSSGIITEEEFRQRYMDKAKELQKLQNERVAQAMNQEPNVTASMTEEVGDIEIKTEE